MAKKKRNLKVKFPEEKQIKKPIKEEELEEIIEEPAKIPTSIIKISSSLELSENNLETQVAGSPEANSRNPINEKKPLYEPIKYTLNQSDYQENSYEPINFASSNPSLSINPLQQQNILRNPMQGFRQANPFNPQGYPKLPEKNYETINTKDNKRKKRM